MEISSLCLGCFEDKGSCSRCQNCGFEQSNGAASPHHLAPGSILNEKYLIGKVLGQGGFGITYLAYDLNLDIKLAIKEYFPQGLVSRSPGTSNVNTYTGDFENQYKFGLDRFMSEAKTLARFSEHPNIVTVRDFFRANGTAYVVMNYLEGITFEEYLKKQKGAKVSYNQAIKILMPVMDALREVHSAGFLHRDVSPDNILINQKGQVILIDFGSARQELQHKSRSFSVTMKVGYSPEEQYRSKGEQGPWTDIYAVAATIYRAITGDIPPESMDRLAEDTLVRPSLLNIKLTKEQEQTLLKALAVRAKDRYQTVLEMQSAFLESPQKTGEADAPESIKIAGQAVFSDVNGKTTSQEPDKLKTSKEYLLKAFKIPEALLSEKQTMKPKAKKIAIALLAGVFLLSAGSAAAYYFMPINELEIEPKEMTLVAGEDIGNYRIIVKPSFVKKDNLVWDLDTENSSYAAIRKGWNIQPLKPGSRTITISTKDGRLSASCKIIVVKPTITWKGGTYSGELKDGTPHGEGEWSNSKGETYSGRWVNGEFNYGLWTHPSGEKYDGYWKDGKYNQKGVWTHPSGEKYDGLWKDGVFHGLGTWYGPNGEIFVGQFRDGLWHGRGEYTDKTGKTEKWIWDSGKKIDDYIAAIDAEVVRLRFFESGYYELSLEERFYSNRFAGYQTRYIVWELELHFPSNSANRYFSLTHVLSRINGGEIFRETIKHEAPANWDGGYWPHSYGSQFGGAAFNIGKYRVEVLENGRVVASGIFEIY